MERGRFQEAYRTLKRVESPCSHGPLPPPHALWRLGRWLAEKRRPRRARLPLRIFLELYPHHQDRPEVMRDLALVENSLGRHEEAAGLAEEVRRLAPEKVAG